MWTDSLTGSPSFAEPPGPKDEPRALLRLPV